MKWWWLLAVAGCDRVLGLGGVHPLPDAPIVPDAPPCVMPLLYDTFDDSPPCSGMGFADFDPSTTMSVAGGRLVIQPGASNATTRGGCLSLSTMSFDPDAGVFVQATSTHDGGEYMYLAYTWAGTTIETSIGWGISDIEVQRSDSSTMQTTMIGETGFAPWVRARPLADGSGTMFETSPDGLAWQAFATDAMPPPAQIRPSLYGGTFAAESSPRTIYFDGFDACP